MTYSLHGRPVREERWARPLEAGNTQTMTVAIHEGTATGEAIIMTYDLFVTFIRQLGFEQAKTGRPIAESHERTPDQ